MRCIAGELGRALGGCMEKRRQTQRIPLLPALTCQPPPWEEPREHTGLGFSSSPSSSSSASPSCPPSSSSSQLESYCQSCPSSSSASSGGLRPSQAAMGEPGWETESERSGRSSSRHVGEALPAPPPLPAARPLIGCAAPVERWHCLRVPSGRGQEPWRERGRARPQPASLQSRYMSVSCRGREGSRGNLILLHHPAGARGVWNRVVSPGASRNAI